MTITTSSGVVINARQITTISQMYHDKMTKNHYFEITLSSQQVHTFMDKDEKRIDKERDRFISLIKD